MPKGNTGRIIYRHGPLALVERQNGAGKALDLVRPRDLSPRQAAAGLEFTARGMDAYVFRFGDKAVKLYRWVRTRDFFRGKRPSGFEVLSQYQEVTASVGKAISGMDFGRLELGGQTYLLRAEVARYDSFCHCAGDELLEVLKHIRTGPLPFPSLRGKFRFAGMPVAVQPYIDGETFEFVSCRRSFCSGQERLTDQQLKTIERTFGKLREIAESQVKSLARDEKLSFQAPDLYELNVKVVPSAGTVTFVITDLCAEIL